MFSILGRPGRLCDGMTRRELLTIGALGIGGLALPDLLRAEASQGIKNSRKAIIMIYLCGAPPHQDMYDIKVNAPAKIRGEFQPIATNVPGIEICEHLPRLAAIMDKLVPIRTMYGSTTGDHDSHICYTGRPKTTPVPGGWPSLGSTLSKLLGSKIAGIPPFVGLAPKAGHPPYGSPGLPGFLGPSQRAFSPQRRGPVRPDFERRHRRAAARTGEQLLGSLDRIRRDVDASGDMAALDSFTQQALGLLTSSKLAEALDVTREDAKTRERYGHGVHGQLWRRRPPQPGALSARPAVGRGRRPLRDAQLRPLGFSQQQFLRIQEHAWAIVRSGDERLGRGSGGPRFGSRRFGRGLGRIRPHAA